MDLLYVDVDLGVAMGKPSNAMGNHGKPWETMAGEWLPEIGSHLDVPLT